jgi:hypothetical protein
LPYQDFRGVSSGDASRASLRLMLRRTLFALSLAAEVNRSLL